MRRALPGIAPLLVALGACGGGGPSGPGDGPGPVVVSVAPAPNGTAVAAESELLIRFDRPLDPDRIASVELRVAGRWSGPVEWTLSLENDDRVLRAALDRPLAAGERVFATLVADRYRGAGGASGPGHSWTFRVATGPGDVVPVPRGSMSLRRGGEGRIQTYGAHAADLNGDGWGDLTLPNELSSDIRILMNDGAGGYEGAFTVVDVPGGSDPSTNEARDLDGDGDLDFVVGSARGSFAAIYTGDGRGGLEHRQNLRVGLGVRAICLLDFENDGDADIVATAAIEGHVTFFENGGAGSFRRLRQMDLGNGEWSCAAADANGDGRTDVFVGLRGDDEVVVLGSRGDGSFVELDRTAAGGDPWMLVAADLDADGHADIVGVNADEPSLAVIRGDGGGGVELAARHPLDGFPLAVDAGDLDGDGALDIVVSNFSTARFDIFRNAGGTLTWSGELAAPGAASCAVLHDRDNDGDLDLTGIDEVDDLVLLFENGG